MDNEHFQRIKKIFKDVLQQEDIERPAFLKQACGGDSALLEEVEKLLSTDSDEDGFLETPVITTKAPGRLGTPRVGTRIGQYMLVRVISSGGMGIVYEARQEHPKRTVAVKLMKPGAVTRSGYRRFEYEAQILASLRHPGIAQIIETGTYGEEDDAPDEDGLGMPYLVMEYIPDASSITDHAFEKNLPIKERLKLFLQVCAAVHHGHQKGIIHRDLKPGNILVDGQGHVKIIDFGVARATESDIAITTIHTEVGQLIGTLQYMSPEQCEADPGNLDIRSDVYALGVVLYELLCEELPYKVKRSAVLEAARLIREEPPRRPSTINRTLRGDMETILLKALEKERSHRYQTVADIGEDLRRYLEGEVILAKPAGFQTRMWKTMKRNPVLSASIGLTFLAVLTFLGYVLFVSYPQIKHERDIAEMEKKNALEAKMVAAEQARIANERYEQIIRLSDVKELSDLVTEAETLWPAIPERVLDLESWLIRSDRLMDRLEDHRLSLDAVRAKALPFDGEGEEAPRVWTFEDTKTGWLHDTLTDLVTGLERLSDPEEGQIKSIQDRLAFASKIEERSILDHLEAWNHALISIADKTECPLYGGLCFEPQVGLVPIGRDPESGLWEFAHLQTGEIPERGEDGKLILMEEMGLVFVLIPGGTFQMGAIPPSKDHPIGSPHVDPRADQYVAPLHEVEMKPFFLSKYEMTQGQWLRFTKENPSIYSKSLETIGKTHTYLHPVEYVSWDDCGSVLFELGLRFPSESEWEYAARAGTCTVWWTGNEKETLVGAANILDLTVKTEKVIRGRAGGYEEWIEDGYSYHAPVGSYRANAFGLHDICGNLYELCQDSYVSYEITPRDGSAYESLENPGRVIRGGAWNSMASSCRSCSRIWCPPDHENNYIGVRPARDLQ